jgi:serine phosphatase RsbU (regulator of sigma subunit)
MPGLRPGARGELAGPPVRPEAARHETIDLLLVEDDDGDAVLVEDQLAEELPRARVLRRSALGDALTALGEGPDCVLLDLRLPDATGLGAVASVRSAAPSVPLIVLTGLDDEAAGMSAVDAGAQDFLVKGKVGAGELGRSIRYAIGRHRTEEAERELLLAQAQAREVVRLERGLAPELLINSPSVRVASCYRAGRSRALLGGDFYDAVEVPDGRLRVVVGDVCGHGADEAAVGVCLRSAWRALALAGETPTLIVKTLERVFEQERHVPSLFATLCMLDIALSAGDATITQAGHPPPLLIAGEAVISLVDGAGGPPIGVGFGGWRERPRRLSPGSAMLLYTDGIIEGRVGPGPERLGEDGLRSLVSEYVGAHADWRSDPDALLDELVTRAERLNGRSLSDDVAMVLIIQDS